MNVSGKLIIQGKAWGEFESAKRSKGNIEISGYRSYGGTHTVRMVDQPRLNENQKIKTNNNLLKINDLAFDLQHDDELTAEQFLKVKQIFELSLQYQLDENQQIVLDWLKAYSERSTFSAMYPIFQLGDYDRRVLEGPRQIDRAFSELNFRQESQVLQAYSQWALEQEEE